MNTRDLVLIGVGGLVLYYVLKNGLNKATDPLADKIAKLWMALFDAPGFQVAGNVQLPDGSTVPLASLQVKTDANHNVYTQVAGHLYQLQPSDPATGNWPAVLVQ